MPATEAYFVSQVATYDENDGPLPECWSNVLAIRRGKLRRLAGPRPLPSTGGRPILLGQEDFFRSRRGAASGYACGGSAI